MGVILTHIDLDEIEYLEEIKYLDLEPEPEPACSPKVYLNKRDCTVTPAYKEATTSTMIVCLDCNEGQGDNPLKTFATRTGRCNVCGGRSYLLAGKIFSRRGLL